MRLFSFANTKWSFLFEFGLQRRTFTHKAFRDCVVICTSLRTDHFWCPEKNHLVGIKIQSPPNWHLQLHVLSRLRLNTSASFLMVMAHLTKIVDRNRMVKNLINVTPSFEKILFLIHVKEISIDQNLMVVRARFCRKIARGKSGSFAEIHFVTYILINSNSDVCE